MNDASKPMDSNSDTTNPANPSVSKFVSPGILLFIDQLIIAAGGWVFWLVISKFVTTSEIGHATAIYSLVLIVNTITQLGLEYPLLRKSSSQRSKIFGTAIAIELAITAASVPIVLYVANNLYQESQQLALLAIGILILSSAIFIIRFALLGLSKTKIILVFDTLGTGVKFVAGFVLISEGYGAIGILLSFLMQSLVIAVGTLFVAKKLFGFSIGNMQFSKEIIKDGLINMPSKLSSMLIVSLSVVLLASFGTDSADVGIFYIAMMISIVAGSFAASLAFMSIPASSELNSDLSSGSLRIGLSFTVPIIAALVIAPKAILSIIGAEYILAAEMLTILSLAILPSVILSNAISRFNNLNKPKKLLIIGSVRIIVFLASFFILVPQYGSLGAAYSILVSFSTAAMLSLIWAEKVLLRYIAIAVISIAAGIAAGELVNLIMYEHSIVSIFASITVSFMIILALKVTSIREIRSVAMSIAR